MDARIVIASVDTYLRFAEAVNRLDLTENGSKGLPELLGDVTQGAAKRKTAGAIDAVIDPGEPARQHPADQPDRCGGDQGRPSGSIPNVKRARCRPRAGSASRAKDDHGPQLERREPGPSRCADWAAGWLGVEEAGSAGRSHQLLQCTTSWKGRRSGLTSGRSGRSAG